MSSTIKIKGPNFEVAEHIFNLVSHMTEGYHEMVLEQFPMSLGIEGSSDFKTLCSKASKEDFQKIQKNIKQVQKHLACIYDNQYVHVAEEIEKIVNSQLVTTTIELPSAEKQHERLNSINLCTVYLQNCKDVKFEQLNKVEDYLQYILVYAAAYGGLAYSPPLENLYKQLIDPANTALKIWNNLIYAELNYKSDKHSTNIILRTEIQELVQEEKRVSMRRWFVDPVTQILLLNYYDFISKHKISSFPSFNTLRQKIRKQIDPTLQQIKPREVFRFLLQANIRLSSLMLPNFLRTYAVGDVFSGSTESEFFKLLLGQSNSVNQRQQHQAKSNKTKKHKDDLSQISVNNENELRMTVSARDNGYISDLLEACKQEDEDLKEDNPNPRTPMEARKILIEKASRIIKTAKELSLPAKILIEFILDGVSSGDRWEPGKGTAYRYLNNLNTYWLYLWNDIDITELGPDEASDIYNNLLVKHGIEQKILYDLLPIFYKFISTHHARHVEIPITYLKKHNHVRSKLVPASLFHMARKHVFDKYEHGSDIIKKSADCILILAYRVGMRPKEIYDLKLSAISKNAAELLIVVGKTASAARRIPLYILLNDSELGQLEAFVTQRKAQEKKGSKHERSAYLFKQSHNSNEQFNEKLINRIVTEFISAQCPARTVFYQFRHTLTTNLFLVCFCSNEVVKQFSDYSDEQINKIRDYLGIDENKTCAQISGLIGHLEPNMTISRYCHLMEFCLYEALCNTGYELTIGQWVKQIKTPKAVIAAHLQDAKKSNDPINVGDIKSLIIKKLNRYADILQSRVEEESNFQPLFNNTNSINVDEMIKTCSMADAGDTVNDISKALATNQYIVAEVLSAVKTIKADPKYMTLRNKSTLTSNTFDDYSAPTVSSKVEMQEVSNLFKTFTKNSNEAKEARKAAEQFLNTSIDHNYLIFGSFQKLKKTIYALNVLDKKRWHVTVDLPTKGADLVNLKSLYKLLDDNQIIINQKSVSGESFAKGRFKLKLAHLKEHTLLNKISSQILVINPAKKINKYGTNSIKVAIFWALVYLRAESEYELVLEDKGISGEMGQLEFDYL